MSFTLDTSHFEMSPIYTAASEKRRAILVMRDTSHSPIGPCGPLGQSPFGDNLRHASTALLSLGLECGENAGGGTGWDTGEIVGLSFKFWESYNESTSRCILYEAGSGLGEIGNINLARTTTTRIRRHADYDHKNQDPKPRWQTNLCMLVYCFGCLCLRVSLRLSAYLSARVYQCMG